MSVTPAIETWACSREGCEFEISGEPDDVLYRRRVHELLHEDEAEARTAAGTTTAAVPATNGVIDEPTGKSALEMAQEARRSLLARPLTVRCVDCLWEATGETLEVRREWAMHRRDEHDDPSALESIERVTKPLTQRDLTHRSTRNTVAEMHRRKGGSVATTSWPPDEIVEAIKAWEREHGSPPTSIDWAGSAPERPTADVVKRRFGNWANAIVAAGFPRPTRGGPGRSRDRAVPPPVAESESIVPEPLIKEAPAGHTAGTAGHTAGISLVERARAIEEARARLTQAQSDLAAAVDAMRDALNEAAA